MVRAKATRENMFVDRSLYRKSVSKRGRFWADFFTQHHSWSISCSNFEPRNSGVRWVKIYYRGRRELFKMRAHESHWQDYSNSDPCPDLTLQLYHRLTIHGPPAGIGWSWVSIPVVDLRRLGFKFGPKAETLKSPFLSMPWSSNIRQKNWRQKTDEMVANDTKMVWSWKVTYNCSETLTGTWLALQNVKQWVLKFNLGTQYVYPHKRASFIRLLNSHFFFSGYVWLKSLTQAKCSLVPRPVHAIRVTRGGLEASAIVQIFPKSLTGDVISEIPKDDWEQGWAKCTGLTCLQSMWGERKSISGLALHFQPCSRPFVRLLEGTWICKNTDCFAVYFFIGKQGCTFIE